MRRFWFSLVLLFATLASTPAFAADLFGQVVDERTNKPVVRAVVTVAGSTLQTNSIGMFELRDVNAGTATVRVQSGFYEAQQVEVDLLEGTNRLRLEMAPADPGTGTNNDVPDTISWVDISALGVVSNMALEGTTVAVRRFDDAAGSGEGTLVAELETDGRGLTELEVEHGFYRFEFNKTNWEPLTSPSTGTVEINADTNVDAGMKPLKFALPFWVRGSRPEGNPTSGGIDEAIIEVVGVDPDDHTVELTPLRQFMTDGDGRAVIDELVAVTYRVRIKKSGYKLWEEYVLDFEVTSEEEVQPVFQLNDTTIEIEYEGLYDLTGGKIPPVASSIRGVPGSGAEGVYFSFGAPDIEAGRLVKRYERILPGMYDLTIRGSGEKKHQIIHVYDDQVLVVKMDSTPPNTHITGQVRISQGLNPSLLVDDASEVDRILEITGQPVRVVFQASQNKDPSRSAPWFMPQWRHEVMTDANGRFEISVPKGRYGIELPDMAGFTGYQVEVRDGSRSDFVTAGWPYSQPWTFNAGIPDRAIVLDRSDYDLNLEVHHNSVEVVFSSYFQTGQYYGAFFAGETIGSFGSGVLNYDPELATWSGSTLPDAASKAYSPTTQRIQGVEEGLFTASATHALYTFNSVAMDTRNMWADYPGALPKMDPSLPAYFEPGLRYDIGDVTGTWADAPSNSVPITVNAQVWCPTCNSNMGQYNPANAAWMAAMETYVELSTYPEVLWDSDKVPNSGATLWVRDSTPTGDSEWHRFANVVPGQTLNVFAGGGSSTQTTSPPAAAASLLAYNITGETAEGIDPGIDVTINGVAGVTGGAPISVDDFYTNFTSLDPRYTVVDHTIELASINPLAVNATLKLERNMTVAGTISLEGGGDLPPVQLQYFDRNSNQLGDVALPTDGSYLFGIEHQATWIRVHVPGFIPIQRRIDPPMMGNDVTGADFTLRLATPPVINSVTADRYGNYIPGVLLSSDPEGVDPENAKSSLTATYTFDVTPQPRLTTYDPFPGEPVTSITETDEVAEVWIIDQREFPDTYLQSTEMDALPFVVAPANYQEWATLRDQIVRGFNDDALRSMYIARAIGGPNPDGSISAGLQLWNCPLGVLDPVAVVVTHAGAVAYLPVTRSDGAPPLRGVWVGDYGAFFLNQIGSLDNMRGNSTLNTEAMAKKFPEASLLPSGSFSGTVGDQSDGILDGSYITYDYRLGVVFKKSLDGPQSGTASMLPADIGFKLGGEVALKSDGRSGSLGVQGTGSIGVDFSGKETLGALGFARSKLNDALGIELSGGAKGKVTMGSFVDYGNGGVFPGYSSKFSIGAEYETPCGYASASYWRQPVRLPQ